MMLSVQIKKVIQVGMASVYMARAVLSKGFFRFEAIWSCVVVRLGMKDILSIFYVLISRLV